MNSYNKRICTRTMERRARKYTDIVDHINILDVFERDKWRCQLCYKPTPYIMRGSTCDDAPEIDHVMPLSKGGTHTLGNLQCLCRACNALKKDDIIFNN